ncbi:MAG: glycosyltransferase family A protein [Thermoguttaceae bacterium]
MVPGTDSLVRLGQAGLFSALPSTTGNHGGAVSAVEPQRQSQSNKVLAAVAVITRTKDRPLLLKRALESVCRQTFKDLVWVVINNGGAEHSGVDTVVAEARAAGTEAVAIHCPQSLSIEAASNHAIHAVQSRYIVVHDDDDSWQPTFLERTTSFLDDNPSYGGVITHATAVTETLTPKGVEVVSSRPFNSDLAHLYLVEMLEANRFPPISFLFRRDAYVAVGDFDDMLPPLADWEFNVRFMQKYDIGVIPELLANYHWRVEGQQGGVYGNTVVAGHSQHLALDVVIRNRMLRRDLEAGRFGPGCMMSLLRWQRRMLDRQGATVKLEAMVTQEAAATREALARCEALARQVVMSSPAGLARRTLARFPLLGRLLRPPFRWLRAVVLGPP